MNVPKVRRALKRGNTVQLAKTLSVSSLVGSLDGLGVVREAAGGRYRDLRDLCLGAKIIPNPALRKAIVVKEVSP